MKLQKAASFCRKTKIITIDEFDGNMWIGDGMAAYRVYGKIKTDDAGIGAILDITADEMEGYSIWRNTLDGLLSNIKYEKAERLSDITEIPSAYNHAGAACIKAATKSGVLFFNRKYIVPVKDDYPVMKIHCGINDRPDKMVLLKNDKIIAVISPMTCPGETQLKNLKRLVAQIEKAQQNRLYYEPEDGEQVEFDDYPYDE